MPVRLSVNPTAPDPAQLELAAAALVTGGIVALPTDTLYGLAVDPRDPSAVDRLLAAKGRPAGLGVPLIAADLAQVEAVGRLTPADRRLAERCWPGPLSLVLEARSSLARPTLGPGGTVAVRVPAHAVARGLSRAFGYALTATSANRSGEAPAETAEATLAAVGDALAVLLDAGRAPGGPPSTIVQLREGRPTLLRAGAVPWARVLELLR